VNVLIERDTSGFRKADQNKHCREEYERGLPHERIMVNSAPGVLGQIDQQTDKQPPHSGREQPHCEQIR